MTSPHSMREAFSSAQRLSIMRAAERRGTMEKAAIVLGRADRISAKATAHFEKHRERWITRTYGQLLLSSGIAPSLRPRLAAPQDQKAQLYRAAQILVHQRQRQRLQRIHQSAHQMALQRSPRGQGNSLGR